jgi:peptidoglycan/xylan/chitin deacetylase (PgdA/CDA1 family)
VPTPRLPAADLSLRGLRAALPVAYGLTHGDPAQRMVALTFDDGPSGRTPAIVRVLTRNGAHATFFVVGRATRGMETVLRHIAATGNELADHTYSHADLLALRPPARKRQLQWTRGLVARATGRQPHFFRPPYGATGPAVNRLGRSLGLIPALWSVDSRDWQLPGTKAIVRRVLANVRPGAIVLMHDGGGDRQETLRALPAILRALKRRHLQVVTLSRMFASAPPASSFWSGSFEGGDARS